MDLDYSHCASCYAELKPVFPGSTIQMDNALEIKFGGGYGMFIDPLPYHPDVDADEYTAILCHDCACKLCSENPWIYNMLQPTTSHSHPSSDSSCPFQIGFD